MRIYWAICLKIGPAVFPHHWFDLGRRIQISTTYFGLSVVTIPAKVPLVHHSPPRYFPLKATWEVPDFAPSLAVRILDLLAYPGFVEII